MSSIYVRGNNPGVYWVGFTDAQGLRHSRTTGVRVERDPQGNERARLNAKAIASELERLVEDERRVLETGPLTLATYARTWSDGRAAMGLESARDCWAGLRDHVLPVLGARPVAEIRREDVRLLFLRLMTARRLANKSILNVYGTLHSLFEDAVADGLCAATPCTLKKRRRELPENVPSNPLFQRQAVYSLVEARLLCLEESIKPQRRVLYACLFFGGMRIGEMLGRRWDDYDTSTEPLGTLTVHSSWNTKRREERATKTRRVRLVPIHPELARVLAEWRLSGWAAEFGRPPRGADFIIPPAPGASAERPRSSKSVLKAVKADCRRLGLRERNTHDTRHTFISLCRGAGAVDRILRWISHGPGTSTILDRYTQPIWPDLCAQVMRHPLRLAAGGLFQLSLPGAGAQ